ncbi:phospho-N-acetylmuramoyl-pentapeptide-transferase [Nitratifractor salsuginis]|uniref:Phospho-N-acetylmuramoyl-pentapeptide-transferase n=1 Tax=Nitratifractor salsuginis (strain DSM 16511 / JCM 12458 / E9I37-1) TaxID=749222 RepID=E6X0N7_NITSE|nr:phospho-N-acetylmuramoyl-pentapeptide-transferase [Nitratifractor salsuginis]ADV45757.1 Phospho-N-acetylmuramoyl-pentapeptide-transferase [Nitratifractor salsuginis DSM 16511]
MFYYLHEALGIHLFYYISVRAGLAFFIAFCLTLFLMPRYIAWAKARKANQPINKYVPAHEEKQHTPTMGGAIFVFSTVIASLLTAKLNNWYVIGGLLTLVGFAAVGFKDDLGKVLSGDNLQGLTARGKMALLILVSLLVSSLLVFVAHFPTTFYVPFIKTPLFDMGYFAILFWTLVIIATSNAVNLTDGLDGLATVPTVIALGTLGIIVYLTGHAIFSKYLLLPYIPGVGEITIVAAALAGGLLGFLWYNCYPAEVFMGDTGSLSIGAFLAYMAILGKSEVLLILIGIVFVIETVSVILQVGSWKLRQKRVFLMAPIHHHFEMKKWAENKIIVRFWMVAFLANLLALITLKIR